jgi:hypothetical protein
MHDFSVRCSIVLRSLTGAFALSFAVSAPLSAQSASGVNQGALSITGTFDVPSVYFFRGIRQEGDPKLTMQPSADVRIALSPDAAPDRRVFVHLGLWNSLHTGSSGTGGPLDKLHYQEDFYAALDVGLSRGLNLDVSYIARTSPNGSFDTIQEADIKVSKTGSTAPYALFAFELSDRGQADGGSKRGTYLELGAGPSVALRHAGARLSIPVKLGLSLKNYYELFGTDLVYRDHAFGFFSIGGLLTVPIGGVSSRFGAWNVHGGADVLALGDTARAFNRGDKTKVIGLVGLGVTY